MGRKPHPFTGMPVMNHIEVLARFLIEIEDAIDDAGDAGITLEDLHQPYTGLPIEKFERFMERLLADGRVIWHNGRFHSR